MPYGVIEWLRMCLKEFRSRSRSRKTSKRAYSDSLHDDQAQGALIRNVGRKSRRYAVVLLVARSGQHSLDRLQFARGNSDDDGRVSFVRREVNQFVELQIQAVRRDSSLTISDLWDYSMRAEKIRILYQELDERFEEDMQRCRRVEDPKQE